MILTWLSLERRNDEESQAMFTLRKCYTSCFYGFAELSTRCKLIWEVLSGMLTELWKEQWILNLEWVSQLKSYNLRLFRVYLSSNIGSTHANFTLFQTLYWLDFHSARRCEAAILMWRDCFLISTVHSSQSKGTELLGCSTFTFPYTFETSFYFERMHHFFQCFRNLVYLVPGDPRMRECLCHWISVDWIRLEQSF